MLDHKTVKLSGVGFPVKRNNLIGGYRHTLTDAIYKLER